MELELRHLRVLCTIADSGSVGRAAAVLGASQPATSTQLRRIERNFGAPLFERTASGVAPTCFGVEVLAAAREVLARIDSLGRLSGQGGGHAPREVRLVSTSTPILPGLLGRTRQQRPDLRFTVGTVPRCSDLVELLERAEADAAVAVVHPGVELRHSQTVAHRCIVTEPLFVALPAGHHLGHRAEIALSDLAEESWLLAPDDGAGWPGVFHRACAAAGFSAVSAQEFRGGRLELQDLIAAGLGISLVPASTRPLGAVVVRPLAGAPIRVRHLLLWRTAAVGEEIVETLFVAATTAYRDLIAGSPQVQPWTGGTRRMGRL
ncbi:LysR family transcriptional regulator [Kitasatospora sp. NBC_01287]|uniref:LysR family transcriptional regulator n=1 Tax=Kitasatospora sp. NBC_01287 TaxID=2903573 RepID=UPI00225A279C|nr:LysR family transcriptional regulator [Kitasatospora sp. NBC_01287]MCX4745885.1 LysR family transcriptional regulator [Kitasatospora sp. NBC_01287]